MLVLSRKLGESIVVGEGITITVTRITKDRVRLGITAPGEVRVDRSEVRAKREATPVDLSECPPAPLLDHVCCVCGQPLGTARYQHEAGWLCDGCEVANDAWEREGQS